MTHESYIDDREAQNERTPMLGRSSSSRRGNGEGEDKWTLMHVLQFFGGGIYAPDPSTYDPIEILLNTEDEQEKDDLTIKWRDNRLSELSFVGVVVCLSSLQNFCPGLNHYLRPGFYSREGRILN